MPRGKLKIQWIVPKGTRNSTFRKRRATLLEKAKELSILCKTQVAMVVYGPGDSQPAFFPPDLDEAKAIIRRYLDLPEASKSKEGNKLDNEGFMRKLIKKIQKRFENYKARARQLEINLILNDISLGRRRSLDDLAPELAAAVRSEVELLRKSVYERMNKLTSGAVAAAVVPPPLAPEEAAAAVLVSSQQEPLMVAPLAMAPPMVASQQEPLMVAPLAVASMVASQQEPQMVAPPPLAMSPRVANAPLFVLPPPPLESDLLLVPPQQLLMMPPPLEPDLLLVPPQQPLMVPPPEPPMVPPFPVVPPPEPPMVPPFPMVPPPELPMMPPFPMAPPMVGDVLVPQGDPLAPAAFVGIEDDDGFPRGGSYLLEMADAILDDGSGDAVQATEEDVERLLREHGLESFIKPKPPM